MAPRIAIVFIAFSSPIMLLASIVGGSVGEVLFTLLAAAVPVALMTLGAQRHGSLGPLVWPLVALLLILEAGFIAMLILRGSVLTAPWLGGLPLATAIQFYGLFLLPLLLVSLAYAWTFERYGLRQEDLDELRQRFGGKEDR